MNKNLKKESILFNNILLLSRNKVFYTKFDLVDSFENRIHLIFFHISFLFIKIKQNKLNKEFYQKSFDFLFKQIELNMRELGYGDVQVNKNMKFLIKNFYNILLYSEIYRNKVSKSKEIFFLKYLKLNGAKKHFYVNFLIEYFNIYEAFCFDLSDDSVLRGDFNFKHK